MSRPPRVPNLRLPRQDKPFVGGTATSVAVHGFLLFLVFWTGTHVGGADFRAIGGPGPLGGGGGGGGSQIVHIDLPPYVSQSAPAQATQQEEEAIELPIPRPDLRDIPAESRRITIGRPTATIVPAQAIGRGPGSGGDEGAGTGSGGGVGSGHGTGVGSGVGPGTGGEGGDGFPARSRQMLLPPPDAPPSVKGQEFKVRFWIDERGRVTRIEVEPRIADGDYRREFRDRMGQFRFYPARNLEGAPVPSFYDAWITP